VNLLDLSALAVPAGFRSDGAPWGVTFIARAWQEAMLLSIGAGWHAHVDGNLGATDTPLVPRRPETVAPVSTVSVAVVGAHLSGLPLNHQLLDRGARLGWSGNTAPHYRLYALQGTTPPKPGLVCVARGGAAIAVEVWELPVVEFGSFVVAVPPPLSIGTVELANGERVKGFLCEPVALAQATDISASGGWRAYLAENAKEAG
jgi:allophanate hydrolase